MTELTTFYKDVKSIPVQERGKAYHFRGVTKMVEVGNYGEICYTLCSKLGLNHLIEARV